MTFRSVLLRVAAVGVALFSLSPLAGAQVTTGSITGVVVGDQQQPIEEAQIQVVNRSTGFTVGVRTNSVGRYTVPGLEVGSAYAVTVRRIGYQPETRENVRVSLSQTTPINFTLVTQATVLGEVTTVANRDALISPTRQGVSTSISDTALRRLPTLNRNFTDFVALTPQVSSAGPGLSGGGTNNRYNNIQIDGATEADLFGLGSTGQPGGQASGKSIGIESVKEYQVLLTPFDVRQGNFAGLLVNAVTKSGTNEFHGSAIASTRNQGFTRTQPYINKYEQTQYGISVGGPIVKDRAFFFFNPEFQRRTTPAGGMFIGGPAAPTAPPTQGRLDTLNTYLRQWGLPAGGGGLVNNENPLHNVFGRLDINLPYGSQLVLRHNYGYAADDNLSRSSSSFRLDNNAYFFQSTKNASVVQLRTLFGSGMFNELMVNRTSIRDRRLPFVSATPEIQVNTTGYSFFSGAENASHRNELDQDILELTDNFTVPIGAHRFTIGTQNQFYKVRNLFGQYANGFWRFASLDSLRTGTPNQFIIGIPLGGTDGAVRFRAAQYAVYAQDEWAVTPRLNLTIGLRADIPTFRDRPAFNQTILTTFNRNTSDIPTGNVQWSPRVGFNWNATGDDVNQLRGGVGLFTGRPAFVWLSNAFQNSGSGGFARLTCNATPNPPQGVPAFTTGNIANPPRQCLGGLSAQAGGEINLADPDLKFPQNLRTTLGYDRRLAQNWVATIEGLYTRGINGLFYQNIALAGPQGRDAQGRTIYGAPGSGTGNGTPVVRVAGRTQVFDVTNQSNDYAYQLTGQLQRRFADNYEGSVAYTYGRAFDVQSFTSSTAFSQYRFGRPWGGDQSEKVATRSIFEQEHRIVAQGTYSFPTKTDVTLIYFGESGNPYDYTVTGDLNGDGITRNDPLYIPRNARDATEFPFVAQTYTVSGSPVTYSPTQQAEAFERFIQDTPCLNENRGRIVPRNACENPWSHELNVSLRQSLPQLWAQNLTLQLDVFNFLNLLNKEWGEQAVGGTQSPYDLLDLRGRTAPPTGQTATFFNTIPTWSFNPNYVKFVSNNLQSNYQIQMQLRYAF